MGVACLIFHGENFCGQLKNREIRESFLPQVSRYRRYYVTLYYLLAAKVTVEGRLNNSHSCKHAYNVSVEEQFNLLSRQSNSNELTAAPAMQNYTIIHTSPTDCEFECPVLTTGSTYLIAGQYQFSEDSNGVKWELPNSKTQSLVSKWEEKYSDKLQEWIDAASNLEPTN